jgi:hypothetical protein
LLFSHKNYNVTYAKKVTVTVLLLRYQNFLMSQLQYVAFENADNVTMPFITLVMKFLALPATSRRELFDVANVLTRRITNEKVTLSDTLKFNVIDKIMKVAPHFCLRLRKDVSVATDVSYTHLAIVIDTSGSMRSTIRDFQARLKDWIDTQMFARRYTGLSIIFFDSQVYGPFADTSCLTHVHGEGSTRARPALVRLREVLTHHGLSHVIFVTDGVFDDKNDAYQIGMLPNVDRFALIFPSHTPEGAENEHFAYLPRVTPAGIPIFSKRVPVLTVLFPMLDSLFGGPMLTPVNQVLYTKIANEYLILRGMTIAQMNTFVGNLLEYPEVDIVHNVFSYIIGMYDVMMTRSGDLRNTLRSEEMRHMWGFLQPLKKRLAMVSGTNVHFVTTSMVREFLETYEATVVDKRDKRIEELKRMPQTPEIVTEIAEIHKAFSDMKKVDDYDRIMEEIRQLSEKNFPILHVKFNYVAQIMIDVFKGFPNIKRADVLEIYKMIASIGVCDKTDPDALPLVCDPHCYGLILVLRLMTYRKTDEIRMTLTVTHITRLLFGFYATQFLAGYQFTTDHARIRTAIWKFVTVNYSYNVLSNITNLAEPTNCSPEWIRILAIIAQAVTIRVSASKAPIDKTLWIADGETFVLNKELLGLMLDKNNALYSIRVISELGAERSVRVATKHPIVLTVDQFKKLVVVRITREQTPEDWLDEVCYVKHFADKSNISVTNRMLLQERLQSNVQDFVTKYWESGHRLICKTGNAHPASCFGDTYTVRPVVDAWMRAEWATFKRQREIDISSPFPVVPTNDAMCQVAEWLYQRSIENPMFYITEKVHTIPIPAFIRRLSLAPRVASIATHLCTIEGFSKMTGDEQSKLVNAVSPTVADVFSTILPVEMEERIATLLPQLAQRFAPMDVVEGVGRHVAPKIRTCIDWEQFELSIGESLRHAEEFKLPTFTVEDFTCPLSGEIFTDPVSFGGHMYERTWLLQWFEFDRRRSSPLTRQVHDRNGNMLQVIPPPSLFIAELAKFKASQLA